MTVQAATAPAVTQQPSDATIASGGTATFTATASGDPTPTVQWAVDIRDGNGFKVLSDGTLGNGATYAGSSTGTLTITNVVASMSGYQYEAIFTNSAGGATSSAGTLTVQTTAPAVTEQPSDATIASGATATFTATASGDPTPSVQWDVNIGDGNGYAALSDGTLGNGATYAGSSTDTLTITNAAASMSGYQYEAVFTNSAGNATSNAASLTVEAATAPVVTQQPSDATITSGGTATFTAMASGDPTPSVQWAVNIGDGNGFNNISDGTLGNGATYAGSGTGTLTITNATTSMSGYQYEAVFTNGAGNATTNAASLTVEAATTVTGISSSSSGTVEAGSTIPITVTFSEAVDVTGTPELAMSNGATATYASGSGTTTLTFDYLVVAGQQNTTDLDYASTTALTTPSGSSIADAAGNAATLTLPTPASSSDSLASQDIIVEATATVTGVSSSSTGAFKAGSTIPITVTFSEAVDVTGTPQLALNNGATATYASGSGTTTLTFDYVVVAGQENTTDLDYASTTALTTPSGSSIADAEGNAAALTLPTPAGSSDGLASQKIVVRATAPTVRGVSSSSTGTVEAGSTIPITVTFSEVVDVTGTPQLALSNGATATYASGSGTTTLTFDYVVVAGQEDTTDLDYASTTALTTPSGSSIADAAGNAATLTLPTPAGSSDGLASQKIIVDTAAPTVTSVSSSSTGSFKAGSTIAITVTFSEAVDVTGTPQLALNDSGTATYASGSGSENLVFDYTVGSDQDTTDLDYLTINSLTTPTGSSITDAAGNAATLTLPTAGGSSDGLASKNIIVDTTAPTVASITSSSSGAYNTGAIDPHHDHLQRIGRRDGHAPTGLEQRRHGQLRQRQRHDDAHVRLHRRVGGKHH